MEEMVQGPEERTDRCRAPCPSRVGKQGKQRDRNEVEKGEGKPLIVLPEGESINYFARLRNPVPHACFYKGAMETATEGEIVSDLEAHSPYWIVIISRDLIGWGTDRYGEKSGSGEEILRWVNENYKQVASIGGDPLDYRERGAILLRKYAR